MSDAQVPVRAVLWDFGGVFTTSPFEAFARYEYMSLDAPISSPASKFDGFTVGANWFINSAVKFTLDWSINFASFEDSNVRDWAFTPNSAGFRTDAPGETDQWALRAQLQLLF